MVLLVVLTDFLKSSPPSDVVLLEPVFACLCRYIKHYLLQVDWSFDSLILNSISCNRYLNDGTFLCPVFPAGNLRLESLHDIPQHVSHQFISKSQKGFSGYALPQSTGFKGLFGANEHTTPPRLKRMP